MTESAIVRQILDWLAAERIFAFRLNSAAFAGDHNGKQRFFRAHSLGKGAADILAIMTKAECDEAECWCARHYPLWIECKTGKGKQSPEQKSFQQYVESLGHKYILAKSVDDVREVVGSEG